MECPAPRPGARTRARYAREKAEAVASFAAFTRGEIPAPAHPLEVFLEISNLCNAQCVMCSTFSAFNPNRLEFVRAEQRGHMFQVDEVLQDEWLLAHALNVHLFGFGEPTIHPRFQELLHRVSAYEVITDFFTNGMKLTDDGLIETLLEARVERVTLSFSGHTKELYENVYLGCSWERVLGGLRLLAEKKRLLGARFPELHVNSLGWAHHLASLESFVVLMADHGADVIAVKQLVAHAAIPELAPHVGRTRTPGEVEKLRLAHETARRLGVELRLSHGLGTMAAADNRATARNDARNEPLQIERFREHASTIELKKGRPDPVLWRSIPLESTVEDAYGMLTPRVPCEGFHCMEPFKTFYVRRQGLTKPCCFMLDEAPALGDVTTSPSLDVWQGPGYQAVRQASLESTYPETGCGTCIRNRDGPPEHFAAYLFERYATWFQDAFGVRFEAEPGLLISDARTIGELHSARVELSSIIPGGSTSSHLEVEGFLDLLSTDHVEGWAWLPSHGEARLPLTIWVDSRMIGRTVARDYRPDVHAVGKGDGRCGFRFCFPECDRPRSGSSVSVTVADTPRQLPGSPRIFVGDA